jgi:hypothetical protein
MLVHAEMFKCQCVEIHAIKSLIYYIYYEVSLIFVLHLGSPEGARGSVVVKALCYKPAGRGFDSR